MANSEVRVILSPGNEVALATDNPNISDLVDKIVELGEALDIDGITVTCDANGFDADSFTEIIKDSSRQFLDAIRLEKKTFDSALAALQASKSAT